MIKVTLKFFGSGVGGYSQKTLDWVNDIIKWIDESNRKETIFNVTELAVRIQPFLKNIEANNMFTIMYFDGSIRFWHLCDEERRKDGLEAFMVIELDNTSY